MSTHTHTHCTNDKPIQAYHKRPAQMFIRTLRATVGSRNQECVTGQLGSGQLTQSMKRRVSKLTQRNVDEGNYLSLTSQHCAFVNKREANLAHN